MFIHHFTVSFLFETILTLFMKPELALKEKKEKEK